MLACWREMSCSADLSDCIRAKLTLASASALTSLNGKLSRSTNQRWIPCKMKFKMALVWNLQKCSWSKLWIKRIVQLWCLQTIMDSIYPNLRPGEMKIELPVKDSKSNDTVAKTALLIMSTTLNAIFQEKDQTETWLYSACCFKNQKGCRETLSSSRTSITVFKRREKGLK